MSEVEAVSANNAVAEENSQQNDKAVKSRKSKSPRISTIDRTKEESEAITKGISSDVEGRRITRSAAKGVTATPPPPAKKERKSTPAKGRGRPKKGSQNATTDESDSHDESKDVTMAESGAKNEEKKDTQPVENNTHEEKEELANNNAEASKETDATENGAKEDSVDASTSSDDKKEESEKKEEDAARPAAAAATDAAEKPAE